MQERKELEEEIANKYQPDKFYPKGLYNPKDPLNPFDLINYDLLSKNPEDHVEEAVSNAYLKARFKGEDSYLIGDPHPELNVLPIPFKNNPRPQPKRKFNIDTIGDVAGQVAGGVGGLAIIIAYLKMLHNSITNKKQEEDSVNTDVSPTNDLPLPQYDYIPYEPQRKANKMPRKKRRI